MSCFRLSASCQESTGHVPVCFSISSLFVLLLLFKNKVVSAYLILVVTENGDPHSNIDFSVHIPPVTLLLSKLLSGCKPQFITSRVGKLLELLNGLQTLYFNIKG